jgi:hypothetical protein
MLPPRATRTNKAVVPGEGFIRPALLTAAWTLQKGPRAARCTIWSHPLGFELRLLCGEDLPRIKVCRTPEAMVRLQAVWRAALEARGWRKKPVAPRVKARLVRWRVNRRLPRA